MATVLSKVHRFSMEPLEPARQHRLDSLGQIPETGVAINAAHGVELALDCTYLSRVFKPEADECELVPCLNWLETKKKLWFQEITRAELVKTLHRNSERTLRRHGEIAAIIQHHNQPHRAFTKGTKICKKSANLQNLINRPVLPGRTNCY